jgi:Ribbon-helix-helix protein, copG family
MNVYFPPELLKQIADLADRKGLSRSAIVEAAVASFLSPDGVDRLEAAFTRRLTGCSGNRSASSATSASRSRLWLRMFASDCPSHRRCPAAMRVRQPS